ncbi:hypothetical protein PF003_g7372 [Phytophthora fragariae]|nr:hypothetical protein PF003_g7372 [Phytophthora fragariae]
MLFEVQALSTCVSKSSSGKSVRTIEVETTTETETTSREKSTTMETETKESAVTSGSTTSWPSQHRQSELLEGVSLRSRTGHHLPRPNKSCEDQG